MMHLRAKTVAVIGAGPSGLVAAKYLLAEKAFEKIVLFEQRSKTGGIWIPTPDLVQEDLLTIPQTDPRGKNQEPIWRGTSRLKGETQPVFLSPIYDRLETNIPRGLMGFQDLEWPKDSQLFPRHDTVLEYIQEYGKDVEHLVRFETQVVDVRPVDGESVGWIVKSRDVTTTTESEETFGAVIVASGHFITPYIPDIPSIREWTEQHPGSISHSKYYRRPEDFTNKKVIVVGNSASGVDISTQIATECQHPLLWSSKSTSMFKTSSDPRKRELPPITHLHPTTRSATFEDGTIEHDIDAIVFATGYFYSLPFLSSLEPQPITDGSHVNHTYQHLFYHPRPTLSFLVLNQRVIPFPMAEVQSAVLARVYAGRLPLPSPKEMQAWEREAAAQNPEGKTFHLLPFPRDADYLNEMARWAMSVDGGRDVGKRPPVWGDWEYWCRENFPKIRAKFGERGEERRDVREVAELGFVFEGEVA